MTLSPPAGTRPQPIGRLAGKRAVVVGGGGAGNIGQAIARSFVAEGASLIIAGRTLASVEVFAAEIGAVAAQCDITDAASIERLFACADGPIDISVNSAGRSLFRSFMETKAGDMNELCAIHINGPPAFHSSSRSCDAEGRLHHSHLIVDSSPRHAGPCRLHGDEGRGRSGRPSGRGRIWRSRNPGQRHRAGAHANTDDPRLLRRPEAGCRERAS